MSILLTIYHMYYFCSIISSFTPLANFQPNIIFFLRYFNREMCCNPCQTFFFPVQVDLVSFIQKSACECLNDADDHPFANCLTSGGGFLESDCDEQVGNELVFNLICLYSWILYRNWKRRVLCLEQLNLAKKHKKGGGGMENVDAGILHFSSFNLRNVLGRFSNSCLKYVCT